MAELTTDTKTWRVLVIDDRTATLKLIEAILLPEGATVFLLEDAKFGLEAVREYDINLILLDIAMPDLNGWDFQQMLRGQHEFDHVAVIGCSAMAMVEDHAKAKELGFEGYITKPFRVDTLLGEISESVEKFAKRRTAAAS